MVAHFIIVGSALCGVFILFLVLSKTFNTIINHLSKIEYYMKSAVEYKHESMEIKKMLAHEIEALSQAEISR